MQIYHRNTTFQTHTRIFTAHSHTPPFHSLAIILMDTMYLKGCGKRLILRITEQQTQMYHYTKIGLFKDC